MGWLFGLIGAILTAVGLKKTEAPQTTHYNVNSWRDLAARMAGDIPLEFLLKWIEVESGGNPCATGGWIGSDGIVGESGIGQLYYPDDFKRFGIDVNAWRSPCKGGARSTSSVCIRPLTGDELNLQMDGLVKYVNRNRVVASTLLKELGVTWGVGNADYWTAVKLYHGLPALFNKGFREGTMKLGHPPATWKEIRGAITELASRSNWIKSKTGFYSTARLISVLNNAEKVGNVLRGNV